MIHGQNMLYCGQSKWWENNKNAKRKTAKPFVTIGDCGIFSVCRTIGANKR